MSRQQIARYVLPFLFLPLTLVNALGQSPAPALAQGQLAGPTPTVNAPAPCLGGDTYILNDGSDLCVERSFTFGELFIAFAVLGLVALLGLRWLYDLVFVRWLSS